MSDISPYFIERTADHPRVGPAADSLGARADNFDLRNYWRILRKYRRLIVGLPAAALMLCAIYLVGTQSMYTASSTLYIEPQAREVYDVSQQMRSTDSLPDSGPEHDYYKTQYQIMASPSLAVLVIRQLHLQNDPLFVGSRSAGLIGGWLADLSAGLGAVRGSVGRLLVAPEQTPSVAPGEIDPKLVDLYLSRLKIKPRFGTTLVDVTFVSPDPVLSARIVNAHMEAYIHQSVELNSEAKRNAQDFMQQKLVQLRQRVEKSEAALNQYRRDRGIVTFSVHDRGQMLMQRLKDLNTDLTTAAEKRIQLETQHQLVLKGDYEALPEVLNNNLIQQLKQTDATMAAQFASLSNRFNPGYHPLDDLKARLDESQHNLNSEVRAVAAEVEAEYRAAVSDEAKLQTEIDQVRAQAVKVNDASLQDAILARDVDSNRQLYKDVLQRMNEVALSADVPISNVSVVDSAKPPLARSSPRVGASLLLSGLLGLVIGCGLAFTIDFMDDTLASPREVEDFLHLPTLSTVPDFAKLGRHGRRLIGYHDRRAARQPAVSNGNGAATSELIAMSRTNPLSEAYRTARTTLMFSRAGGAPKTILVTSSTQGEGKTVSAANLAVTYAQMGGRTVVVDADLRQPRVHKLLGVDNGTGLSDILAGQADLLDVIRDASVPGVSIVTAGSAVPNPGELLGSPQMRQLLQELGKQFDYVVMDSPPIMPVSDAVILGTMVDGVLLVVSTQIPKHVVRDCYARLRQVGAKVLGVMLTKVDTEGADYQYYHHYSYGYSSRYYESAERSDSTSL